MHETPSIILKPGQILGKHRRQAPEEGISGYARSGNAGYNDIAGVRVVCNYIDDVYRVAGMLERQEDLEIVKRQDYIKTPNYNGYRSLHLDVRVPVYLSDRTEHVVAEIQIRTIAMDFWASLEHDIHYKADRAKLPAGIDEEMFACAEKIAEIDRQMQDMYRRHRGRRSEWRRQSKSKVCFFQRDRQLHGFAAARSFSVIPGIDQKLDL